MGANVSHVVLHEPKPPEPLQSEKSTSEEPVDDERRDSLLLSMPKEVLESIVGYAAAGDRVQRNLVLRYGWRGAMHDGSMPTTSALALTCHALSRLAVHELWRQLDIDFGTLQWLVARKLQNGSWASLPLADRQKAFVLQRHLPKMTTLHFCSREFWLASDEASPTFALEGLSWITNGFSNLAVLSIQVDQVDHLPAVLGRLQALGLRLHELSLLASYQMRRGALYDQFWEAQRSFLDQQMATLTSLTLHWQPAAFAKAANSETFDLAQALSCPKLTSFDYIPFGETAISLEGVHISPLRVLSVHHCRLSVVAELLAHLCNTLEILHLHYEPPLHKFVPLVPGNAKSSAPSLVHAKSAEQVSDYHYLSSHHQVRMPDMPKLDRLVVDIKADRDGPKELHYLLSSFSSFPIRQLWICVAEHDMVDEYWYKGVMPNLRKGRHYAALLEVRFGTKPPLYSAVSPPIWPTDVRRFRTTYEQWVASCGIDLHIYGVRGGMDVLHTSVVDMDPDAESEIDSASGSEGVADNVVGDEEFNGLWDDFEADRSRRPECKLMPRAEWVQTFVNEYRPKTPAGSDASTASETEADDGLGGETESSWDGNA